MNVLFLTLGRMDDIKSKGIYTDLLRQFEAADDEIYVVSMHEKREKMPTTLIEDGHIHILQVRTGNIRECGLIEKGISTVLIETQYMNAINKYYGGVKFDLVLYSTPPITFSGVVEYVKERDGAKSYLLLKDIFPQNAVDLGMIKTKGVMSLVYKYFRHKEIMLYKISDYIGCMSPKNCEYLIQHNYNGIAKKVEVCANCIDIPQREKLTSEEKKKILGKNNLPTNSKLLVYGGNLGKAQGIKDLIECLKTQINNSGITFLIVGKGTEYSKLETFIAHSGAKNIILKDYMPVEEYNRLVSACDVGMLFLDHRFTIPNFPSRLLSYLGKGIPVLTCTDSNTDVGEIAEKSGFGWKCLSGSPEEFAEKINEIQQCTCLAEMGQKGYEYLRDNYDVRIAYNTIMAHFERG